MSHNSFLFALVILHLPENVATNQVCVEHVIINFFSIHVVQSSDVWKVPTSDKVNPEDIKLVLNRWKKIGDKKWWAVVASAYEYFFIPWTELIYRQECPVKTHVVQLRRLPTKLDPIEPVMDMKLVLRYNHNKMVKRSISWTKQARIKISTKWF